MQTKKQFTPGPWKVRTLPGSDDCFVEGSLPVGKTVAGSYRREIMSDEEYPEKIADARLIAAAPDMLEALGILMEAEAMQSSERKWPPCWRRNWEWR